MYAWCVCVTQMHVQMQHACQDIDKVTATPDYASAVPQLGLRLGLLKRMAQVVADVP